MPPLLCCPCKLWPNQEFLKICFRFQRPYASAPSSNVLREGDRVLLRYKGETLLLTKPLRRDGKVTTRYGDVNYDSLIGKQVRDTVSTTKSLELRVHLPTLEEYVTMTPRLVTPIYPKDASLIVSLLDLHPSPRPSSENLFPPLEILEAGTGHGALTLHLARAIHAANPPLSEHNATKDLIEKCRQVPLESAISMTLSNQIQSPIDFSHHEKGIDEVQILSRNTSCRQAIIHTIDISPRHSEYATKIVRGFRRGQYANDVDFHVGDVSEWIDHQRHLRQTDSAFLSHIILDMPSSQVHVEKAASALCVNGSLIVFNPSITQITACVKDIKDKKLPLQLEHVLELGPTMTGGREWDVRAVKPRAIIQAGNSNGALPIGHNLVQNKANENMTSANEDILGISLEDIDAAEAHLKEDTAWEMVCRPKVGDRVIGGGFLGVWEKMRERKDNPVLDSIG